MKRSQLVSILAAVTAMSCESAASVAVFFVGGQSNATASYSNGITAALQASNLYEEVLVVHANHSGSPSYYWKKGNAAGLYEADFFSATGTGRLQQELANLTLAGKTYDFSGLFWFQGEATSDRTKPAEWQANFQGMLSNLRQDLGDSNWKYVVTAIDANAAFADEATVQSTDALRSVVYSMVATDPHGLLADSRGYTRTDTWHLTTSEGHRFGGHSAAVFIASVPEPATAARLFGVVGLGLAVGSTRSRYRAGGRVNLA